MGGAPPKGDADFFTSGVSSLPPSELLPVSSSFEAKGLLPPDEEVENGFIGDAPEVSPPIIFEAKGLVGESSFFFTKGLDAGVEDAKGFIGGAIESSALFDARILAFTFSASSFTCRAFSSVAFNCVTIRLSSAASSVSSIFSSSVSSSSSSSPSF